MMESQVHHGKEYLPVKFVETRAMSEIRQNRIIPDSKSNHPDKGGKEINSAWKKEPVKINLKHLNRPGRAE